MKPKPYKEKFGEEIVKFLMETLKGNHEKADDAIKQFHQSRKEMLIKELEGEKEQELAIIILDVNKNLPTWNREMKKKGKNKAIDQAIKLVKEIM